MRETSLGFHALLLAGALVTHAIPATAACEAKSGSVTVALLELYTSEGCDSYPPADRWIAELPKRGFGLDRVVPLSLHVDYWNYLGWADPFSHSQFTQRQREFARRTNARTVYTPEFVMNGREYRRWTLGNFDTDLNRINRAPARADVALRLERSKQTLRISGAASVREKSTSAGVYLALYENNLQNDVRAGENSGHKLRHDFVVRQLIGPIAFDAAGKVRVNETIALDADWKILDLGVAAFVQDLNGTEVWQALAVHVCQ